jgi:hypothetical protein
LNISDILSTVVRWLYQGWVKSWCLEEMSS